MRLSWVLPLALAVTPVASFAEEAPVEAPDEAALSGRQLEEPDVAFARAISGLELQTQVNHELWGQGSSEWSVDLDRGVIEFRNDKGWLVTAPVQVIGTYDTRDGTFMWGWDHPSVPAPSAEAATLVRQYGERHHLDLLTTLLVEMSEERAWEVTALADYLSGGNGAYRGPVGTTLVFMTFGTVSITGQ